MAHLDDLPMDERFLPRSGPMFSRGSSVRAELATDLAIPILAEGGWSALTMRRVALAANVTPQAIAAWFPWVAAMRAAVAERYGNRWLSDRRYLARIRLSRVRRAGTAEEDEAPLLLELAASLLPESWLEETYDGIWLTIVEAGRWDETIGEVVAAVHERERDVVCDLIDPSGARDVESLERDVELVLAVVHGLRASHAPARKGGTAGRARTILAPRDPGG